MAGLAPGPFAGLILADYGCDVIRVDRCSPSNMDTMDRGKRSIALDLKQREGSSLLLRLVASSDVLIEPYRPGVMERMGLGPGVCMKLNPRLIYARLTGFGQTGPLKSKAGHDINYLAVSGLLSCLGPRSQPPNAPINLLADFVGQCPWSRVCSVYSSLQGAVCSACWGSSALSSPDTPPGGDRSLTPAWWTEPPTCPHSSRRVGH